MLTGPQANPRWCATRLNEEQEANKAYPYLLMLEFPSGVKGKWLGAEGPGPQGRVCDPAAVGQQV